jgi:protein-S-isoprenylcysteine O-methyltransferase Ste14
MSIPIYYVVGLGILWMLQLILHPKPKSTPVKKAPKAYWGIVLQIIGGWFVLLPARTHWTEPIALWRICAGTACGLVAIRLVSAGIRHLGKQWQVKAALNPDHELVTSGPYRIIRHPIYAAMLGMFLMTTLLVGRLPWWPIGLALFLTGIEIRVHVEDGLLRARFGSRFEEWTREVPAYLPLLR